MLLIVICPLDGMLNLTVPLVLINKSRLRASTGFHLLPSLHHHPIYKTLTLQNNYTYSHPNLTYIKYRTQIQMHIPHVMWSGQEVHELKIDHTNTISLHSAVECQCLKLEI